MKTRRSRLGLSILAGGLSFVGSASAVDLIVNGSFENASGGEWKYYATYNHSTSYFGGPPIPDTENPGANFSWRHSSAYGTWDNFVTPTNEVDHLQYNLQWADSQTVNLTNALAGTAIDAGLGRYSFSSWLASYGNPGSNPEQPYLVLRFFDDTGTNQIGSDSIFDRTGNIHAITYADGNTNIPADVSADHSWIKYAVVGSVPTGARKATVYITRSPNAAKSGTPDTYVDLLKLDVINVNDTTSLDTSSPANGQVNVSPGAVVNVGLRDINTQVNTNSILFSFDGAAVTPSIQKSGTLTSIQYDPPGLLAAFVTHVYRVVWSDNGVPVTTKTNQVSFTVAPYVNINLGTPLHQEPFDGVAEGALPAGWSVQNYTDPDIPGLDLNNFKSDSYMDWVVISRSTLSNLFGVIPGGGDFPSTLNVAPGQVINGSLVTNLIDGNFIFAVSDRDNNQKQVQYLFTRDYDLSGKNNVYLSFHSIYTQNQDSMGSVEYSLNGGATWLPAQYMLDGPVILRDNSGGIDASNTFAFPYTDGNRGLPDIDANTLTGGHYGWYIGVNSNLWSTLAPYLSARVNDDQVESKRIEIIRLAQADNQPAVRFRFAQVGTWSWYFGIDSFGLYSLTPTDPPALTGGPTPATSTVLAGNAASFTISGALGLGPISYQWRHSGANLPGRTSQTLVIPVASPADAGSYDVVVSNPAGSVTSAPPAAVLTVINPPVFVTGQWDFNGNLAATLGADLQYFDNTVQADTTFGTTTSFGIGDMNGQPAGVMHFLPTAASWGGYRMFHGAAPNGGGAYVNQYTVVLDVYFPTAADRTWRSLWQTDTSDLSDGDLFLNTSDGLGISSVYDGSVSSDTWHRIAFAFDLTGPGSPVLVKFIDGAKVGNQTSGLSGKDGRFSLDPSALLFGDNDGDVNEAYVSSAQFSNGRRPDAFLAALGGASAAKIPGSIKAAIEGGRVVIRWTGGVPLQSADSALGPWSDVSGATSPYPVPTLGTAKLYRPKIP